MTTFQDPPLQSRRSVRQNERDQSQPPAVASSAPPTASPGAPAEPLTYSTQGRAPVPDYDGPAFRARRTPDPVTDADVAAEMSQEGGYRPRDFSPEGRRAAQPSWAPQYGGVSPDGNVEYQTQQRGAGAPPVPAPADPNSPFAPHEPVASTIIPSALDSEDALEHTLTRRELRALRDAHGITSETTDEAPPAPPVAAPAIPDAAPAAVETPLAAPSTRLDSALAEFDQLAAGRPAPVPSDPPPPRGRRAAAARAAASAPEAIAPESPASAPIPEAVAPAPFPEAVAPAPIPEAVAPAPIPEAVAPIAPAPAAQAPAPAPAGPAGPAQIAPEALAVPLVQPPTRVAPEVVVAELVAEPVAPTPVTQPAEAVIEATIVETVDPVEPPTSTPPTGHWSTQAQLDDETQTTDSPLSRNIGNTSGAITTSALVLPSIPNHDFGPLSSGEILVTGSISLSEAFTTTGAHPAQLDESDLDHLLDPGDHQVSTGSQPVRAIKAVSTHTSSRGVIQNVKPKGTRGLTALIIAATGMAVVVGALFIVLVATGQL
ncbi:MAG: hypothetical protein ABIQ01_07760 [Pseudolysinimonas sp.]